MRKIHLSPFAALVLIGCVPRVVPPPAPSPAPVPMPAPAPAPTPSGDWRDWPLTPGDWHYRRTAAGGVATFGVAGAAPGVTMTCDRAAGRIRLVRAGASPAAAMKIVTTSTTRTIAGSPDGSGGTAATIAATDSLLDAIGYSRGRFVIEQAGLPTLVIPAWPEIERVTEDCRP